MRVSPTPANSGTYLATHSVACDALSRELSRGTLPTESRRRFLPIWQDKWQDSGLLPPVRRESCQFGRGIGRMDNDVHERKILYSVARPEPVFSSIPNS